MESGARGALKHALQEPFGDARAAGTIRVMAESDPLQILLAHDRWATAQILDVCGKLSDEQFHRRFDIGPGSLHDTLTHVLGAMRAWTETLAGAEPRPRLDTDGQRRTVGHLTSPCLETFEHRGLFPADVGTCAQAHGVVVVTAAVLDVRAQIHVLSR